MVLSLALAAALGASYASSNLLVTQSLLPFDTPHVRSDVVVVLDVAGVPAGGCALSAPAPVALTVSTSGALTSLGVAMEAVTDAAGAAVCRVTLKNVAADPLSLPSSGAVALGMTVPPTQVAWSVSVTSSVPEKIRTPSKGSTQLSGVSATIAAASGKAMVGTSKCGLSLMPSVFENTAADFTDSGFHVSNALCSVCEAPQPESVWGFQLSLTRSLGGMICVLYGALVLSPALTTPGAGRAGTLQTQADTKQSPLQALNAVLAGVVSLVGAARFAYRAMEHVQVRACKGSEAKRRRSAPPLMHGIELAAASPKTQWNPNPLRRQLQPASPGDGATPDVAARRASFKPTTSDV